MSEQDDDIFSTTMQPLYRLLTIRRPGAAGSGLAAALPHAVQVHGSLRAVGAAQRLHALPAGAAPPGEQPRASGAR
jgi:hypothetical protein